MTGPAAIPSIPYIRRPVPLGTDAAHLPHLRDWIGQEFQGVQRSTTAISNAQANSVINVKNPPYNAKGDGTTDDTKAIQAAIAAAQASGFTIYVPPGVYLISSTLAITATVRISGGFAAIDNVTAHSNPVWQWTGGAAVFLSITGTAATGTIIENIGFDNSGSGTVAMDIDGPISSVRLLGCAWVSPQVPWTDSAIRVGHSANTTDIFVRDCVVRNAAPVGLRAVTCSAQMVLDHTSIQHCSTVNVLIGTTTQSILDFQATNGSTFEQDVNLDSVYIQRGLLVRFDGCYFENSGTGFAINIPSTATLAEDVVSDGCWYSGIGGSVPYAINSAYASGDLVALNNHYTGFVTAFIKNGASRRILSMGNMTTTSGVPHVDATTNVVGAGNIISATITPPTGLVDAVTTIPGNPTNVLGTILGTSGNVSWVGTLESSGAVALAFNAVPTAGADLWTQSSGSEQSMLLSINGASGLPGFELYTAASGSSAGTKAVFWGSPFFSASADTNAKIKLGATASLVGFYGITPVARQLLATGAGHTVDDVITALQTLGLVRQT